MNDRSKQQYTIRATVELLDKDGAVVGTTTQQIVGSLRLCSGSAEAFGTLMGEMAGSLVGAEFETIYNEMDGEEAD